MKKNHKVVLLVGLIAIGLLALSACTVVVTGYAQVFYYPNNATNGSAPVDGTMYNIGDLIPIAENTGNLTKENCVFIGWNTDPNGQGTEYVPGSYRPINVPRLNLYAEWMPFTAFEGTWKLTYEWDNMQNHPATAYWYIYSNWTFADDSNGRGTWDISGNTVEFHYTNGTYYVFDFTNTNYISSNNYWGTMSGTMSGYGSDLVYHTGDWSATKTSSVITSMAKSVLVPGSITPSGEVVK